MMLSGDEFYGDDVTSGPPDGQPVEKMYDDDVTSFGLDRDDPPEDLPRCDICGRLENDSPNVNDYGPATEADWNGETGNHAFCEARPVTVLDVARARGAKADERGAINGGEFVRVGLDILGGCEVCEATIAAYNAYPSQSGYWRCATCVADDGFATVAEFEKWAKAPAYGEEIVPPGPGFEDDGMSADVALWMGDLDGPGDTVATLTLGVTNREASDEDTVVGVELTRGDLLAVRAKVDWLLALACTSDDAQNHQGDTCPIHEAG